MSLKVKRIDPYNDSIDRKAWERYCIFRGYDIKFGGQKAIVDGFMQTSKGVSAFELACNKCWVDSLNYPVNEEIHIPSRKLEHFCKILEDCEIADDNGNWTKVKKGYFVLFNIHRTRAAFVEFQTILDQKSDKFEKELNGEKCEVVTIPHNILQYIKIPSESQVKEIRKNIKWKEQ